MDDRTEVGIDYSQPWVWNDTKEANNAWNRYVSKRRVDRIAKRPVADILIGAFAVGRKGLLTRNENAPSVIDRHEGTKSRVRI